MKYMIWSIRVCPRPPQNFGMELHHWNNCSYCFHEFEVFNGVGGQEASNCHRSYHHLTGVSAQSATSRWKPPLLIMFVPTQNGPYPWFSWLWWPQGITPNIQLPLLEVKVILHSKTSRERDSCYCSNMGAHSVALWLQGSKCLPFAH